MHDEYEKIFRDEYPEYKNPIPTVIELDKERVRQNKIDKKPSFDSYEFNSNEETVKRKNKTKKEEDAIREEERKKRELEELNKQFDEEEKQRQWQEDYDRETFFLLNANPFEYGWDDFD